MEPASSDGPDGTTGSGATVASGKGRPTPKRREAEQARKQRMAPPKDRREAAARQRERRREERQLARAALASGDARHLPARDRGPVRTYCRDFVDARRSVAEFMLPVLLLVLVLGSIPAVAPTTSLIFLTIMLAVAVDTALLVSRLRAQLRTRFPGESHKGATLYTVLRSTQLRRLRLPKPQVKPGAKV